MKEHTRRLLVAGASIVPALVEIAVESHRPLEAMTDEILSVNRSFAGKVASNSQLTDYLQSELLQAKREYRKRIQEFL